MQPGGTLAIEFTTLSHPSSAFADYLMLCATPWILQSWIDPSYLHTSAPLLVPLSLVLEMLTSGAQRLTINSIENISGLRAAQLICEMDIMENNREVRTEIITKIGLRGWRRMKLAAQWKAALLATNKMSTWMIKVQRGSA